ncbi:MAG: ATP synthase F0 subunit B [Holophagaceae bacterium]|nr:ATP synthase F0 subunit B [Holophagaceae bacterium]
MKRSRLLSLMTAGAMVSILALNSGSLLAQEHKAPAAAGQAHQVQETEQHGPTPGHGANEQTTAPHEGAATHEAGATHEGAAAHGAEHHGPPIKLFGIVLGAGAQFAIKVINFLIFAGGLIFLTKGALSSAFKARAKELQDRLSQAETDKAEGEAQIKELEGKMAGLQAELSGILQKAEVDAEAEKQRILEGARAEAAVILAQTKTDIENQHKAAEAELRALVAGLATEGAAKKLKAQLQGATASSTMDRAIEQISHAGGLQ